MFTNFANTIYSIAQKALSHDFKHIQNKPCRVMPFQKDSPARRLAPKTNVFVKNLDPSTTSADLYDAFAPFGSIVSCKVADEEYATNHRGFGYINYENPEAADDAIGNMNGTVLNGRSIFVSHHVPKRERLYKIEELKANFTNLYVKNIELNVTDQEFQDLFANHGKLVSYSLPLDDEGHSRGFGFINFESHDQAVAAVSALNDFVLHGKKLYVSRAQKKYEREEEMRQQYEAARLRRIEKFASTNLYIKHLDPSITDETLSEAFSPFGVITSARVMTDDSGISRGFGFVCYSSSEEALQAIKEMHNREFRGKNLYVSIAQRRDTRQPNLLPMHPFFANSMPTHINPIQQSQLGEQSSTKLPSSSNTSQSHQSSPFNQNRQNRNQQLPQLRGMPLGGQQFVNPYYLSLPSNFIGGSNGWNRPMIGRNGEPLAFSGNASYGYPIISIPNNSNYRGGKGGNGYNNGNNNNKNKQGQWRNGNNGKQNGINGSEHHGKQNGVNGSEHPRKQNPQVLYGSTLLAAVASAATPEAEKQAIGEALYPRIQKHSAVKGNNEVSAKLTGMMLDLETTELLKWVDDEPKLNEHIQQAYEQYMDFLAGSKKEETK